MVSTVRWLEMLVVGVYVFDVTGSPFQVALMLVLRLLPLTIFGAIAGDVADKLGRVRLMVIGLLGMIVVSLTIGALVTSDRIEVWHIALATVASGLLWSTDYPTRRLLLGNIAGTDRIGTAMSLDAITNNGTRMLGPLLGGSLMAALGLAGAFYVAAGLYAGALLVLVGIRIAAEPRMPSGGVLANVTEGLRYLRTDRNLMSLMAVTVVFNLWGFPFMTMVPVIGRETFVLDEFRVGLLAACEGVGAMTGAFLIAAFAQPRHFRRLYVGGLGIYLSLMIVFAQAPGPIAAGLAMMVLGLGGAGFSAMQSTLVFLNAPDAMRSRMLGVLSVCIGTGPIGFLHVGWLASVLSPTTAITIIAVEGIVALLVCCYVWPRVIAPQAS